MDPVLEHDALANKQHDTTSKQQKEEEEIPKIQFKCGNCSFLEECDYFGKKPPFANKIKFNENCYVMKDPFAPSPEHAKTTNSEFFIELGAHCAKCERTVCRGQDCSFYYLKTYCLSCASSFVKMFPLEVQSKIKKQIAISRSK